ncbi:MAG TPA: hypothetical protein VNM48_08250, partial [Chloroflexota bacterium]|nr:hypothetical protein [Chloroflexota bacterium]
GVKYPSFANWVQQRKRRRLIADAGSGAEPGEGQTAASAAAGASLQWWEAVVDDGADRADGTGASHSGLRLHLPGGVRMEITASVQVDWAGQLLALLAPGVRSCAQNLPPLRSC